MRVSLLGLFFLSLFCTTIQAAPQSDEKAVAVVKKAVEKLGGLEKIKGIKQIQYKQTMKLETPAGNLTAEGTIYFQKPNRLKIESKVMKIDITEGFNGKEGWLKQFGKVAALPRENHSHFKQIIEGIELQFLQPYLDSYSLKFKGETKYRKEDVFHIEATSANGVLTHLYFNTKTYELVRRVQKITGPGKQGGTLEVTYLESTTVDGLVLSRKQILYKNGKKVGVTENSEYKINPGFADGFFDNPTKKPVVKKPVEKKPEVKKPVEKKPEVKKPVEKKPEVKKPVEKKPEVKKPVEKKPEVKKPVEKKPEVKKPVEKKPEVKKPVEKKPEEKK